MGICKCRKRTDLYCFVHKRAVCADCVVDCDADLAHIGTYVQWLENATPPPATCALSGALLRDAREAVRLTDMRLYARAALDALARALPPHSPPSAYVLPSGEPLLPPMSDQSRLAQRIRAELGVLSWAAPLLELQEELAAAAPSCNSATAALDTASAMKRSAASASEGHVLVALPAASASLSSNHNHNHNTTSNHHPHAHTAAPRRSAIAVLTTRRLLLLVALVATLIVVLFLSLSLEAEELETVPLPFARGTTNLQPLLPVPTENRS